MNTQANTCLAQQGNLQYAIMGLDARYSVQFAIDDISLRGLYVLKFNGRWLGNADTIADAEWAARMHNSLFGDVAIH